MMHFNTILFKHVCFTGPQKEPAYIEFYEGVNLLYGASDTGKSFVLESIEYMLGGDTLRDIPERVGYDKVFLGIETSKGENFTLYRSTDGGNFHLYDGLHMFEPEKIEPVVVYRMKATPPEGAKKISEVILEKIGLNNKRLRKNQDGDTVTLSLSPLLNLCLISEEKIYRRSSLIERGDAIIKTQDHALFKLLLTGVDDSSLVSIKEKKSLSQASSAKLELVDSMLKKLTVQLSQENISLDDAIDQSEKIQNTIKREEQALQISEVKYKEFIKERNELRRQLESYTDRRREIEGLLKRFNLLSQHYQSDLTRLDGICEAGVFMNTLEITDCPYCGALPQIQNHNDTCKIDITTTIKCAQAEKNKIKQLKIDLQQTINQLISEVKIFENTIPDSENKLRNIENEIEYITPEIKEKTSSFSLLIEKKYSLQSTINAYTQISDLQQMKSEFELLIPVAKIKENSDSYFPISKLDALSKKIESILGAWHFPDSERVFFDTEKKDFVIAGKNRGDRGKGMRSIIHSAFNIGLLEFCKEHEMPHLGSVILDSPLLAYREPDDDSDSLKGTEVQNKFYEYLTQLAGRQVIIIENIDPPEFMRDHKGTTHFSKNTTHSRYGFFPLA